VRSVGVPIVSDFSNPYHADRPVEDQAMFFGRNDALLWIEQQVLLNRRLLIIHGPDLIGKTSLLGTFSSF
jgi:hypothetical protein